MTEELPESRPVASLEGGGSVFALGPCPASPGTTMVLLPGIEGSAATFCRQGELSRRLPLAAADLPPWGDLPAMAGVLLSAIPFDRVVLVGASFGGLVAREMALLAPGRVAGLMTIGTLPHPRFLPPGLERRRALLGKLPRVLFLPIYRRRIAARLAEEGVPRGPAARHLTHLPERDVLLGRLDALLGLKAGPEPAIPSIWLIGDRDREAPWCLDEVSAVLPSAELRSVSGGHRPWLSHPVPLHALLEQIFERWS